MGLQILAPTPVDWRYITLESGGQFVMIALDRLTQMLPVGSLALKELFSLEMSRVLGIHVCVE